MHFSPFSPVSELGLHKSFNLAQSFTGGEFAGTVTPFAEIRSTAAGKVSTLNLNQAANTAFIAHSAPVAGVTSYVVLWPAVAPAAPGQTIRTGAVAVVAGQYGGLPATQLTWGV